MHTVSALQKEDTSRSVAICELQLIVKEKCRELQGVQGSFECRPWSYNSWILIDSRVASTLTNLAGYHTHAYNRACFTLLFNKPDLTYQLISQKETTMLDFGVVIRCISLDYCSHHRDSSFSKSSMELVYLVGHGESAHTPVLTIKMQKLAIFLAPNLVSKLLN
jgi:hypothetical protein